MKRMNKAISSVLVCCVLFAPWRVVASQEGSAPADPPVQNADPSQSELEQLVAPIALYPDNLVAQILAASTYPDQIVEADRWVQSHPELKGEALARAADQQPWEDAVKALTAFPAVLGNMGKNLSWASSLGDAYVNHQDQVMDAVQSLRRQARQAGLLESNAQQKVVVNKDVIVVEPATPDVVYVPQYNPWLAYGAPLGAWPDWYWYPGLYWTGPGVGFGLGFGLGFFGGFGWGWHHWGADWHHHRVAFNHRHWQSRGHAFAHRGSFGHHGGRPGSSGRRPGGFRGNGAGVHRGTPHGGFHGGPPQGGGLHGGGFHGGGFHGGPRSGAFGGFTHGGFAHGFGARGGAHFGGGGFHGGGRR
jgi:hypothetical protein